MLPHEPVQIVVGEAEHVELVRAGRVGHEVIVVADIERVIGVTRIAYVLAEGDAFDLGRNLIAGDAVGVGRRDDIEEGRLADRFGGGCRAGQAGYVLRARQVDLEPLLCDRAGAVAQAPLSRSSTRNSWSLIAVISLTPEPRVSI